MVSAKETLRFLQPVTRELVHRSSVSEVFVTDGLRTGDSTFAIAAQWPRDHALYHPDENRLNDPLLFAETLRQAHFYAAHTFFDVPLGHHFVGQDISFEITDHAALRVGGAPLPVLLDGTWEWQGGTPARRAGARMNVSLVVDGRVCGRGHARGLIVDDRRYGLLRKRAAEAAGARLGAGAAVGAGVAEGVAVPVPVADVEVVPPHRVGRQRWRDCVLERDVPEREVQGRDVPEREVQGRPDHVWRLRIDRDHAVLFDHPTDHIPLMVMLEGFRQLGHLTVHETAQGAPLDGAFVLAGLALDCAAFGELGAPVHLTAVDNTPDTVRDGSRRLRVEAHQGGTRLAVADTAWRSVGRRDPRRLAASQPLSAASH
ncbi:ScbA/BarX family gamma-butyrolactone biosynthesis protein [Streptomyces sp. NPDC058470]|uniref:ScbA/BarX family gamma-butyrolactone biosynthesis protein n=1 Tax=Streptomyces sp. NPDC058470 TaxID=3346515 RepID=UPI00364A55E9